MAELLPLIVIIVSAKVFARRRMLRYLRFLQQEEYDGARFIRWIFENKAFDRKGSVVALTASIASYFISCPLVMAGLGGIGLVFLATREEDPREAGKIRLNMTARANRIFLTAMVFFGLTQLISFGAFYLISFPSEVSAFFLLQVVFLQAIPFCLVSAVKFLQGGEDARQAGFLNEAKEKFAAADLYTVGITGSYGKTSTKLILGKLLDVALGPTFFPQKGVNTPMGITREIREKLKSSHRYAVIEMGAYRPGSIKRLCDLTPPKAGIVTAVGLMHLERMGGAENVFRAKSELAQAIPDDGILVCNGDNAGSRRIAKEFPKKVTLLYGLNLESEDLDTTMSGISSGLEGTSFTVTWQGKEYKGSTPLHGRPALSNILGAFTLACAIGADPEYVLAAARNLEPVNNRLEVVKVGPSVQINDAYNSNPEGFAAALEVLKDLPGERKILVTPGMIELGDEQDAENERIAKLAAGICDLVMVVGDTNKTAFYRGLQEGGVKEEQIQYCEDRDSALFELGRIRAAGDVVLIENDLPDLYELDINF